MTHAIVLVEAERDVMSTLGGALAEVEGVREAYSVTGEWDFVCIVVVARHEDLAGVVTGKHLDDARRRADAHDGRVRDVLAARPGGDVLDRRVVRCARPARRSVFLPAAAEPDRAVLPVVGHEGDADGARERQERARRAVMAALAEDPQATANAVVMNRLVKWRMSRRGHLSITAS